MDELITVQVQLQQDGVFSPLAFEWRGKVYSVQSTGRTRLSEGVRFYLVTVDKGDVYEIGYSLDLKNWRLFRRPQDFQPPGRGRMPV